MPPKRTAKKTKEAAVLSDDEDENERQAQDEQGGNNANMNGNGASAKGHTSDYAGDQSTSTSMTIVMRVTLAVSLLVNLLAVRWIAGVTSAPTLSGNNVEGDVAFAVIEHPIINGGWAAVLTPPKVARITLARSADGAAGARSLAQAVAEWSQPKLAGKTKSPKEQLDDFYSKVPDAEEEESDAPDSVFITVNVVKPQDGDNSVVDESGKIPETQMQEASITVRRGDDIDKIVAEFSKTYAVDDEASATLKQQVTARARAARIVPVFSFDIKVDEMVHAFEYFEEDNVTSTVLRFGKKHRLGVNDLNTIHERVQSTLVEMRVKPAASLPIEIGETVHQMSVYQGDDIKKVADAFVEEHSEELSKFNVTTEEYTNRIVNAVRGQFIQKRLLPLAVVDVPLPKPTGADDEQQPSTARALVFMNDSIDEATARFMRANKLTTKEDASSVQGAIARGLQMQGHLPLATVPLTMSGRNYSLPIYQGADLQETVRNFSEKEGLDVSNLDAVANAVYAHLASEKLVPAAEITHELPPEKEGGEPRVATLRFFDGEDANQRFDAFIKEHGLDEATVKPQLQQRLIAQMRSRRMLPIAEVPVIIPEKNVNTTLPVYIGDNATMLTASLAERIGLTSSETEVLQRFVQDQLQRRRAVPILEVPLKLPGEQGLETLRFFFGDNITTIVHNFADAHSLAEGDRAQLLNHVIDTSVKSRLAPVAEVPVVLPDEAGEGAGSEQKIALFSGDDLNAVVEKFAKEKGLKEEWMRTELRTGVISWLEKAGLIDAVGSAGGATAGGPGAPETKVGTVEASTPTEPSIGEPIAATP